MIKKNTNFLPLTILLVISLSFFYQFFLFGKLPVPADTIAGLYHPMRDLYSHDYPNGIPYKNSLITDPVRQQFPWRSLAAMNWHSFTFPVWNQYNNAGMPLLANMQSAFFYPLNLLFFLTDFEISWSILIILQPVLACLFMFLFLRNLKLNQFSAFLGSFVYGFCGFSVAWLEWGTIGHVALWLPLILLSINKIAEVSGKITTKKASENLIAFFSCKKLILWSFIHIISLSSAFFAGHLQIFLYLYLVSVIYSVLLNLKHGIKIIALLVINNLLFLLITSVQWIPSLKLILLSARGVDQIHINNPGWFLPVQNLLQFIAPDFFGNPATLNYWGVWNYGEFIGYVGIFPLIMAIYALFYRYDRKTFFFGSIFFVSLLFALSTWIARLPFQFNIPFISTSMPTRLLFLTDFSLSILAALGLDYFIRRDKKTKIIYPLIFILFVFLSVWILLLTTSEISQENIIIAKKNLILPFLIFLSTFFLIIAQATIIGQRLMIRKKINIFSIITIMLISLTVFDLFRFSYKFTPFSSSKYLYPKTKLTDFLQKNINNFRIISVDPRVLPPNFSIMYKIQSLEGYDPLYIRRYGELIAAIERGQPDIDPPFGFNRIISPKQFSSRLIDFLGVKYVLSLNDINDPKLKKVFEEGQTKVYENSEAFNRAFFVSQVIPSSNKHQSIKYLFDSDIDLKRTAIVEDWNYSKTNFSPTDNRIEIKEYESNMISIITSNNKEAFLILTDTYYPNWKARICASGTQNCRNTRIYLTNYNFRGIIVPPGEHTVIFFNTLL
jgi:hypothetical protein